ncbi:MAG: WD40 repeat domain-containing serine/threonine protein kinase [Isosphaeraceae bacterium]
MASDHAYNAGSEREAQLMQVLDAYLQAVESGQSLDRTEWLAQYPDLALELTQFLEEQDRLMRLTEPLRPIAEAASLDAFLTDDMLDLYETGTRRARSRKRRESPLDDAPRSGAVDASSAPKLRQFGDYDLIEPIAHGGMGTVFKARHRSLNRLVALKMIHGGALAAGEDLQRFRLEAEAVAHLDHPSIVPIYDVGEHDGFSYFSMKLADGGSLAQRIAGYTADPRLAAKLLAAVARAVHHAHQRGILHRDLKPSNILLDEIGQPYVSDFGMAKRLENESELTQSGAIVGTPSYMAPEQASGKRGVVTTAADVYGLGAVLYAMLTGRPPFQGDSALETIENVKEREPDPPSGINRRVDRDLETICLKCLEKEPERRYASALAVALDLERWLIGEPIAARPAGRLGRAWRWCRRNPAMAGLLATVMVLLFVVAGVAITGYARTSTALAETVRQRDQARYNLYLSHMRLAHQDWAAGNVRRMLDLLDGAGPGPDQRDFRGWEWYYLRSLGQQDLVTLHDHEGGVMCVAWSPDGTKLASGGRDKTVKIRDGTTGQQVLSLSGHDSFVWSVAWSPDCRRLAGAGTDPTIRVWDAFTGRGALTLPGHRFRVRAVAFSPDGKRIASASDDKTLRVWDSASGRELLCLRGESAEPWSVSWSTDSRRLAAAFNYAEDKKVKIWDVVTGMLVQALKAGKAVIAQVAWSPDGRRLAAASWDQWVWVWDPGAGKLLLNFRAHPGKVNTVCWSAEGTRLATGGEDGTVRIWEAGTARELNALRGHHDFVESVAWCPDGRLASASRDGTVKIWDPAATREAIILAGRSPVAWSPDGRLLATRGTATDPDRGTLVIFNAAMWNEVGRLRASVGLKSADWSLDGARIALGSSDGTVQICEVATGRVLKSMTARSGGIQTVAWSPDGRMLATPLAGGDRSVTIWDAANGRSIRSLEAPEFSDQAIKGLSPGSAVWSPDGRRLATSVCGDHELVEIWETGTWKRIHRLERGRPHYFGYDGQHAVAWSPRGDRLASGNSQGEIIVWEARTGRELVRAYGHSANIRSIAWGPDGQRLATGSEDRAVKIWDAETGSELLTLRHDEDEIVYSVSWSPDGRCLASGGMRTIKVWEAPAKGKKPGRDQLSQE